MTLQQYVIIAIAMTLGAFVQGAIGFAFAIVATPLIVSAGVPLQVAIAILATAVLIQVSYSCYMNRAELPVAESMWMFSTRLIGLVAGIWVLAQFVVGNEDRVKQVIGGSVLAAVLMIGLFRPTPREKLWRGWTLITGLISGFMAGLVGMGGPPIVLWLAAHTWSPIRTRGFLWLSYLLIAPVQLALLEYKFPTTTPTGLLLGIASFPLIVFATTLGIRVGNKLPQVHFRRAMLGALAVLAMINLIGPMLD